MPAQERLLDLRALKNLDTVWRFAGLIVVYVAAAKLGLLLSDTVKQVTPIWPPTAIAFVALVIFGYRYWPAILVGAFIANFQTQESAGVALLIAAGNTLEALAGAYLFKRYAGYRGTFTSVRMVFGLVAYVAFASTLVSAFIGTTALGLGHLITWHDYWRVWLVWWSGDMMSNLIIAPFLFAILTSWRHNRAVREAPFEALIVLVTAVIFAALIFVNNPAGSFTAIAYQYLIFPLVIWAALRFTLLGATTLTLAVSTIAVYGTLHSSGPFIRSISSDRNLLELFLFIGVLAVTSLILSVVEAERIETEQTLIHNSLALAKARARVVRTMNKRREIEKQKDELVGMASHELKTPLTSAKLFVAILKKHLEAESKTDHVTKYVNKVSNELDRLSKLTVDLIDVNRVKGGRLKLEKSMVDVDELIRSTVSDYRVSAPDHHFRIRGKARVTVPLDRERIRQVLINLLSNAAKHSPSGSTILIKPRAAPRSLTIAVQDYGVGIPKNEQVKIFEPFYRALGTAKTHTGMGLGLYIARQIILLHKGRLWVDSTPKKGSTFLFSLPISATKR